MPVLICNVFRPDCLLDWDGVAAVATAIATISALSVPFIMAGLERKKQQADRLEIIHETCSIVDCILAYHAAALLFMQKRFPDRLAFESCNRICANTKYLRRSLEMLIVRPELSDGAVGAAAAAELVADAVVTALHDVENIQADTEWSRRVHLLQAIQLSSKLAGSRSAGVRKRFKLPTSGKAAAITAKYESVISAFSVALEKNKTRAFIDLDDDPY